MADEYYEDYYYDEPANQALETRPAPFFDANSPNHRNAAASPLPYTLPELDDDEEACMALLRGVPIFGHLSDEGLHTMVSISTVRNFKKGSPIIAEGSRSSDVFVILSGKMEVTEEVPVSAEAAAAAAEPGPEDPGEKPSERLAHAELLAPDESKPGEKEEPPKEQSYALWIDAGGLAEADALWAAKKKELEAYQRKGSIQTLIDAPEKFRRIVERSGSVIGEHAACFGRASASVWCRSDVDALAITSRVFYELIVLAPRPETRKWLDHHDVATAGADALLASCRDDLDGAQVLGMLQARVEALLQGKCDPSELAARTCQLQYSLQTLSAAGLASAPAGITLLPTEASVIKDRAEDQVKLDDLVAEEIVTTRGRQTKDAEEEEAEWRKKEERRVRREDQATQRALGQEEPSPSASLGLASLQKGFQWGGEKAAAPGGFQWGAVKDTFAKKQDAVAKAKWHFFDKAVAMPSSIIDGARAELEKTGVLEDFRYRPPPSNLARMATVAAADWAAGTAVVASAPPPAPTEMPESKPLSNADRRALGLPPAKPAPFKRAKAPENEDEVAAEMETIVANSRKRVERMRGQKYERSLEKAADVLLHDMAWLPGTAKPARLQEVKGLRKQWVELLRGLQQEMLITITASVVAVENHEKAEQARQAAEEAAAWAEHDALFKAADKVKADKQQAEAEEQAEMAEMLRQMTTDAFDAPSAVYANSFANTGRVVASGTTLQADGSVLGADGALLGAMRPDGMVVGKYGAVLGFRKPDGKVRQHPDHLELVPAPEQLIAHSSSTRSDGSVVGPDGRVMGRLMPDGLVVASNGRVLGRRHPITGAIRPMRSSLRPDGTVEGPDGKPMGTLTPGGMVIGSDGKPVGWRNPENGAVSMPSDAIAYDTSVGTDGRVLGADGTPMGKLMPDDMVMAAGGKIVGWRDPVSGAVCILPTGRTKAGDQVTEIFREMQIRSRWTPDQMAELFRQMDTDGNGAASLLPVPSKQRHGSAARPPRKGPPGSLTPEEFARGLEKLESDATLNQKLLYGRAEGATAGAGAILRDILDRRDILARVFGGGAGPNPREVAASASKVGLEAVPAGTLYQKTTLGANDTVLTPMVNTFLAGGAQTGGKLIGKLMPDGMVVGPDGRVVGRRNPKSGAVTAAPAGQILHANTTVWPGVDGGGTTVGADGQYLGRKMPDGSVVGPTGIVIGILDANGAIRSITMNSAPAARPTRGHDQFNAGGAPPSEYGGMAGPGHGLLATQPLRVMQPKGAELYEATQDTLNTFPWHKGQHHVPDHRASGLEHRMNDDIGVWVSSSNPAERAWALDVANHRA